MLSNSVQIALFIILWVTKLIHNKQPMYAVLDKDTSSSFCGKTRFCIKKQSD